jgi:nickel superoxide dismutase
MTAIRLVAALSLLALLPSSAGAHCQIPCGIFDDMMRIRMLEEHVVTIEKSMRLVRELSAKENPTATDRNQLARWIRNKEDHADEMSHVVVEYFLRQRIKAPKSDDAAAVKLYRDRLVVLHEILVTSMKAKHGVDASIPGQLRGQIERFTKLYFSPEQLAHAKEEHGNHDEHGHDKDK